MTMPKRPGFPSHKLSLCLTMTLACLASAAPSLGQQPPDAGAQKDLAQKLSNPVSDLVSMPFQFNWEANVGPAELTRFVLNVQPVMPFSINDEWNLIARLIVPMVSQPPLVTNGAAASGISDVTTSFFFSPTQLKAFIL